MASILIAGCAATTKSTEPDAAVQTGPSARPPERAEVGPARPAVEETEPEPSKATPGAVNPALATLIAKLERGTWGWESGEETCETNPHQIRFTDDGRVMVLTYAHPLPSSADGTPEDATAYYDVVLFQDHVLRGSIRGEVRRTADGEPVVWDLVMLSPDSYCWHRADLELFSCSKRLLQCP